ncbi:hypothetical protein FA95DRAFT_1245314 [Auriscalpium vulgare]|uniref:Uncharacterized protein n=1 Tax=Auriscalpium vulgare TaxID=40419 RepID=A0ACB8S9N1_9AGAM|nr:hypothetical protein FA95DRAFT_1245314 [Auriscalpium vulgare]
MLQLLCEPCADVARQEPRGKNVALQPARRQRTHRVGVEHRVERRLHRARSGPPAPRLRHRRGTNLRSQYRRPSLLPPHPAMPIGKYTLLEDVKKLRADLRTSPIFPTATLIESPSDLRLAGGHQVNRPRPHQMPAFPAARIEYWLPPRVVYLLSRISSKCASPWRRRDSCLLQRCGFDSCIQLVSYTFASCDVRRLLNVNN